MKRKYKISLSIIGSLTLATSSLITTFMVISNFKKESKKYSNNYTYTSENDILDSFNKAKIPSFLTEEYINSTKNDLFKKSGEKDFLYCVTSVQNEISMRRILSSYSIENLNKDINYIKNILINDVETYISKFNKDYSKYDYLKSLYVKNNLSSWSNLNNVVKYDLISSYIESLNNSLESLDNLYAIKKIILLKEKNDLISKINLNNNNILNIKNSIKNINEKSIELQRQINYITEKQKTINNFDKIEMQWNTVNAYYISATTLASVAIASSVLALIPLFGAVALGVGTAAAAAAAGLTVALNQELTSLAIEIENNYRWNDKGIEDIGRVAKVIYEAIALTKLLIKKLQKSTNLSLTARFPLMIKALALITIFTAAFQIYETTKNYIEIRNAKNSYISTMQNTLHDELNKYKDEKIKEIKNLDNDSFLKNNQIIKLENENKSLSKILSEKNENIKSLELSSTLYENSFSVLPISIIKIDKDKLLNKYKDENISSLYEKYSYYKEKLSESNLKRLSKSLEFKKNYNYDDRNYWINLIDISIEPSLNTAIANLD
ncbi:hypothetical protein SLITO_v1c10410 [Spiroplasma litorale]|uniref:Transmembrane protein n=1 Tax=Spiroplasma litorale TaxID=216942 RepID=A0A0K1W3G7_9MOLU|nr:hypothetical protein [Spiroplasma litorale]AKX34652.1 hypothetical protein SLITO_v1c10410 [Spiroplasma litorale]